MLRLDRQFGLYVIREQLEVNATRVCCRAEDPFFDRDVILKLISPEAVGSFENLSRLDPYLESVSGLEHPAIAPLYDNGIESDICYFTTAFYAGGSLAAQLSNPMNIGQSMQIILQLSSGLTYAYNEGFEHGKLTLDKIFFSNDGHAVITDFGIAAAIENLKHKGGQAGPLAPQGLRVETLLSLGEILIKLLLGPGAKPDTVSTAILKQSHSDPVFNLVTDLLGLSENEIHSFDELLVRLTDLAILGSEVGINEYVAYVEQKHSSSLACATAGQKPAVTPSQRQLEIKEEVYAKGEIRRLVAEKSKLQEILRRASSYKKAAENKLAEGAAALSAAQKAEAAAINELNLATFNTPTQHQTHWHPGLWLAGGLLIGSLLTSGYNHFYLSAPQAQLQVQNPQQTTPQSETVTLPAPVVVMPSSQQDISQLEFSRAKLQPTLETTELWWPAGDEFDTAAAVPNRLGAEELQANVETSPAHSVETDLPLSTQSIVSDPVPPDEQSTEVTETLAQNKSESWTPAGSEFDPATTEQNLTDTGYQDVESVVQEWATAWSNQDPENYFSYYSSEYQPEPGRTLEEWRAMRLARLTRPHWIKVMLHDLQLRSTGEDRIQVKLKQSYSSNYYQDRISKSLNLIKENGKWRIMMERSLGSTAVVTAANDMIGG